MYTLRLGSTVLLLSLNLVAFWKSVIFGERDVRGTRFRDFRGTINLESSVIFGERDFGGTK